MTDQPYVLRDVTPGWQYTVYVGAEVSPRRGVDRGTAEKIIAGWAPTKDKAERKAEEVLG